MQLLLDSENEDIIVCNPTYESKECTCLVCYEKYENFEIKVCDCIEKFICFDCVKKIFEKRRCYICPFCNIRLKYYSIDVLTKYFKGIFFKATPEESLYFITRILQSNQ